MKAIFFALVLLGGLTVWSRGGDDMGNGGGLAEKNILVAYGSIEIYSSLCLNFDVCRLTNKERKVLADIIESMPQQRKKPQLAFESESKRPGFFKIDGEMKVAKTGSKIGDPIYLNVDLLYSINQFNQPEAISISSALAILLHEFGHHVSKLSHEELDLMAVKVSMFLQNRIQTTPLLPWNQSISATVVQPSDMRSFPQVILSVGETMIDLSKPFEDNVFCPVFTVSIPFLPFPDLQLGRRKPLGVLFHNVHWEKSTNKEGISGDFIITGSLTHVCPGASDEVAAVNSFKARIYFSVMSIPEDPVPVLKMETLQIRQDYEPWFKLFKLGR